MAGVYDPQGIPDVGERLPPGNCILTIESIDDSEPSSTGKYQIMATLRGVEPNDILNVPHFERFVIGTDTDLEAKDPLSWRGFGAQRYRDMLLKAGVALTGTVAGDAAIAEGQSVGAIVSHSVQGDKNKDGSPNKYAGNINVQLKFFRVGERPVGDGAQAPIIKSDVVIKPGAKAAPKPAAVKPQDTVTCGLCNPPSQVPKAEFTAHVNKHTADEE